MKSADEYLLFLGASRLIYTLILTSSDAMFHCEPCVIIDAFNRNDVLIMPGYLFSLATAYSANSEREGARISGAATECSANSEREGARIPFVATACSANSEREDARMSGAANACSANSEPIQYSSIYTKSSDEPFTAADAWTPPE